MQSSDAWLIRTPPITEAEWLSVLSGRQDFVIIEAPLGRTSAGQSVQLPKLYLWQGGADGDVAFAYSPNGIHISPADKSAWVLAQKFAQQLGAIVTEG